MMKYALLATAFAISSPAIAQQAASPAGAASGHSAMSTETLPQSTAAPAPQTAPAPSTPATADSAATSPQSTASAQPAPAGETVTGATQVAQVVESEFPTYDKDANGALNRAEFTSWMVALKSASDPATKADSADTKAWVGKAFAAADADKSKTVSKSELTGFLAKGSS